MFCNGFARQFFDIKKTLFQEKQKPFAGANGFCFFKTFCLKLTPQYLSRQSAAVRHFMFFNIANLVGFERFDGNGFAVEGKKFDFVSDIIFINMDNRTNVSC